MNEQRYIVRLYITPDQVVEAIQPARREIDAIGRMMLDLHISSASRATAGGLVLYGVRIDNEVFDWDRATWK